MRSTRRESARLYRRRMRMIKLGILLVIAALIILYILGALYYTRHFYGRGEVFGIPVKNQTVSALKKQINAKVGDYQLVVETRDGSEVITARQVKLRYDDKGELDAMLEDQKAFAWLFLLRSRANDSDINLVMNQSALERTVDALQCMQPEQMKAPTDAYLEYDQSRKAFVIREETYGNELIPEKTVQSIADAIRDGAETVSMDQAKCYLAPEIYKDTPLLLEECDAVNDLVNVEITYDFGDRTEKVDGALISQWLDFGDDFTFALNEGKVAEYIYNLAYEYDTFGLSRTFKTHDGTEVKLKGGDYGWCIHKDKSTAALLELIKEGKSVTTEPEYLYRGVCRDANDIGGNYVEVSIRQQMMWVYKDGECIVSTPVVTGRSSMNWDTPAGGVWAVDARITDYTLTGQDYNTEVKYWLPFNGNVGIHDATWRKEFGGSIYKNGGSHGCVNTPISAMKTVYENVQIGYPVVVY